MERTVSELMSRKPVLVDARAAVDAARSITEAHGVHHLLVVDDSTLVGVVCQCDLAESMPGALVVRHMRSPVIWTCETDTLVQAASIMLECGVGCLPVLDERQGRLSGVLTRRDLRSAGILPGERGVDLCASCGTSHRLRAPDFPDLPVFCFECLDQAPPSSGRRATYFTLGGSG
jgi:acetoin utilization protein AcuB